MRQTVRPKVLTSPILITHDNKQATLESTELVYLYNGMKYMGSSYNSSDYQPDIKQEEMGLKIKVTPRINPDGTVVLDFEETFQQLGAKKKIPGSSYNEKGQLSDGECDSPMTRKIAGNISVSDGQTVVIGGLVSQTVSETEGGIPLLKDIPFIGRYLFGYTTYSDTRNELLVFLTPHVFKSSEEAQAEAKRRKDYLDANGVWNKGWSKSELADITNEEEMLRRENQKRAYELKQFKAKEKRSKAQIDRKMAELLEKSIDRKREELDDERMRLSDDEVSAREAELLNEQLMHEALLRSILESEGTQAE